MDGELKLLPCPFCGEQPASRWCGNGVPGADDCGYWGIDCCRSFTHADNEEDAVRGWNRRPTPAPGALPELPPYFLTVCDKPVYLETQMHAYARAYAEQRRAGVWLPIETAPKDGSEMMLCRGERVTYGHWLAYEGGTTEHRDLDGRWIGQDDEDCWEGWMSWDGGFTEEEPPTHWMPLPAPPALQSAFADDEGVG